MTEPHEQKPRKALTPTSAIAWLFAFGLAVTFLLAGALLYRVLSPAPERPEVVEEVVNTATVVTAVRELARLQTISMHIERVVDLRQEQRVAFGLATAEDAILLVAAADVTAGVDLEQMIDGDIVVYPEESRVEVFLPRAEIFEARLDNSRTYVHTRETDVLARRSEQLETRARREAERRLQEAALEANILNRAERSAITTVEALLKSLGFSHVSVEVRPAE